MYCIGLTGNIASGKSTAMACFASLGLDVISADSIAQQLTLHGKPAFNSIVSYFGPESLLSNGELNRRLIRQKIFSTPSQRIWLENLLHPKIREEIKLQLLRVKSPYAVIEIPLLMSLEDYPYLNRILVLLSTKEQQIQRLMQRDRCRREEALAILKIQPSQSLRRKIADDLIKNDQSQEELCSKIKKLHELYLFLAKANAG